MTLRSEREAESRSPGCYVNLTVIDQYESTTF